MPLDIAAQMSALRKEEEIVLPTPPVGAVVQWFERGEDPPKAAQVVAVEGPGKVALQINQLRSAPTWATGVLHATHPLHSIQGNATTFRNGKWDYLPHTTTPKAHYVLHQESIDRRRAALLKSKEEHDQAEQLRKEQKEKAAVVPV